MYLKRIDIHGFKSFSDPVSIEFTDGITCIVGPNGSGKSNISDAIRWVLGEQSPKMLRGGKMEEVIFAGTASRRMRSMAEVVLTINNVNNILPIDYDEVSIMRRMYRSGESEYAINGNPCRLRDIRELIMDTGIGVDGYSLIGQGKISEIVGNKAESRREIFEEAAGVVMYRTRKAEAERKLDSANSNLDRVNDIICEIEGRIDGLREDSRKAREYLTLREEYKGLEINIILHSIDSIQLKNEYAKDDILESGMAIESARSGKVDIEDEISALETKRNSLDREIGENTDALLKLIDELNALQRTGDVNSERLAGIARDRLRLTEEIQGLDNKLKADEVNLKSMRERLAETEAERVEADKKLLDESENFAVLNGDLAKLIKSSDDEKNRLFELHKSVSDFEAEKKSLLSLLGSLEKRHLAIGAEDEAQRGRADEINYRLTGIHEELKINGEKLSSKKESRQELISKHNNLLAAEKSNRARKEELSLTLSKNKARKKAIEEMEANYEGFNYPVKFIMHAGLKGIVGVVSDLLRVPSGYELAIETALGASLQNVVCRTAADARKAIEMLKNNKAGRLTFLPMDTIHGVVREANSSKYKGFIGSAVDCVDFDNEYYDIVKYLLGNVLVFDNLKNALDCSKSNGLSGGFKLVTLEGEIINTAGAITGGVYKNKSANIFERKSEILKLENIIDSDEKEFEDILHVLENSGKLTENLTADISAISEEIKELEFEEINIKNKAAFVEKEQSDILNFNEKMIRESRSIDEQKDNAGAHIEEIDAEIKKIKERIVKSEASIENSAALLVERKEQIDKMSETITSFRIVLNTKENEAARLNEIIESLEASMLDNRAVADSKRQEIATLDSEKEKINNLSLGGGRSTEEIEIEKSVSERYIAELKDEREKVALRLNEANSEKEMLEKQLTSAQDLKYQSEIKQAKYEVQIENYKNRLWDEYEIPYAQALTMKDDRFAINKSVKESRILRKRIKDLGDVNIGAIAEYTEVSERYDFLTGQRDDILSAMNNLREIIQNMEKTIRSKFKASFDEIAHNFEDVFKELFGGGIAELRLDNEDDPLQSGVDIVAQPPGKKLQNINLMSGGEKTMTAIALMFAVLKAKPTPFCILDEVEAALDDNNISRFANYLKNFKDIQFAIVTHQKATMEFADVLYGVTMPEQGISKVISLKLGERFAALS